jgi:hypothetical protein
VRRLAAVAAAALLSTALPSSPPARGGLDDFDSISGWTAAPSEGVRLDLREDSGRTGGGLRLDFDFGGHAGWAAARKAFPRRLPENWAISFSIRGQAPTETLEFKLVDPTGENVWWSVRRGFEFPGEWKTLKYRKRQVAFAWGPARGGEIRELGAIEITVTAGSGGRGSVWIDDLELEELPATGTPLPPARSWSSDPRGGERQELVLDLGSRHELGGLTLDWDAADFARRYDVEVSDDGRAWERARSVAVERGGRAWIALPDAEAAFVRLRFAQSARGRGYRLARIRVEPPEFADTPTRFLESVARESPRGSWPRSLVGEQLYWTVVGVDGGSEKGLLSEDGALETGRGAFSVEPFLRTDGRLLGWADGETSQRLPDKAPVPIVTRALPGGLSLEVTALADGARDASTIRARYRVRNPGASPVRVTLVLALRPVQVNPPWQFLNTPGGFAPIRRIGWDGRAAAVDGGGSVVPLTPGARFAASRFDDGEIVSRWMEGVPPPAHGAEDPFGRASGSLSWELTVAAGGQRDVILAVPLAKAPLPPAVDDASADFQTRWNAAAAAWDEKLSRVSFALPPQAAHVGRSALANLAWILVERDGPALQPGTRSYARSWIRDGALMAEALLRLGHAEEARDFLLWFAPFQLESGAVPCCVDRRGADPVPEHDSHGELIYLAGRYFDFTGDRATLEAVWPHVARAADHIDLLRALRRTAEYRSGEKAAFFGLLPESISHEGYSDHPVHSYWDDFWALRGLSDAARLAGILGRAAEAERFAASSREMQADVEASIRTVRAARGIDFIPGSADLADFDATSTTIALDPGGQLGRLPAEPLERTFEKYWERFLQRRTDRTAEGADYTPYEWRIVGSFVRLGWRERAGELAAFFLDDRRPAGWGHWAEVVWPRLREPKFIGDMPHGWVAADFLRSFLDLFAYERDSDGTLVLGAGIPAAWMRARGGVAVSGLRTRWGSLDLRMSADGSEVRVRAAGTAAPPGGFAIPWPLPGAPAAASVDGKAVPAGREVRVERLPAEIVLRASAAP